MSFSSRNMSVLADVPRAKFAYEARVDVFTERVLRDEKLVQSEHIFLGQPPGTRGRDLHGYIVDAAAVQVENPGNRRDKTDCNFGYQKGTRASDD
jgi:hypothetical protein